MAVCWFQRSPGGPPQQTKKSSEFLAELMKAKCVLIGELQAQYLILEATIDSSTNPALKGTLARWPTHVFCTSQLSHGCFTQLGL